MSKFFGAFATLLILLACNSNQMLPTIKNTELVTIKPNYEGNALKGNTFVNYEDVPLPNFTKALKWQLSKNPQKQEKLNDKWLPEVLPNATLFTDTNNKLVWLGHASFLLTINKKNILIDPVFNDIPFVKRMVGIPFEKSDLKNIHYVCLSHGHFDHCDKTSFELIAKQNPYVQVLGPLRSKKMLQSFNADLKVQEAGWYQKFNTNPADGIEFFYLPSFHWHKRGLNDNNTVLWGSFIIKYNGKTIYFMGDSGYNTHFKEIQKLFGKIDYCLMGIGAYSPSYMMKTSHTNPEEAVRAFHDLEGQHFIPMHYGTYDLSDEPTSEPLHKLNALNSQLRIKGKVITPKIGEVINLP